MFKSFISTLAAALVFTGGCATAPVPDQRPDQLLAQIETVNSKLAEMEQSLAEQMVLNCARDDEKLADDIAKTVIAKIPKPAKEVSTIKAKKCEPSKKQPLLEDRIIFGAVEQVRFIKEKVSLGARVDTGAVSSSLGAYQIKGFERDGKRWVKFALSAAEDARVYEYPIYGTINIKQESYEEADYRFEIKTDVRVGKEKYRKQVFNLADRSHLEYQVLIGRNFLRDIALVDISRKYIQGKR